MQCQARQNKAGYVTRDECSVRPDKTRPGMSQEMNPESGQTKQGRVCHKKGMQCQARQNKAGYITRDECSVRPDKTRPSMSQEMNPESGQTKQGRVYHKR